MGKLKQLTTRMLQKALQSKQVPQQAPAKPETIVGEHDTYSDIYGRAIPDADIIMYPPKHVGIPVFSVDAILKRYGHHLEKVRKHAGIGDNRSAKNGGPLFDAMYRKPVERFIEYAHMLPASEDYHHTSPGGLLLHSLDTALMALRFALSEKAPRESRFIDLHKQTQERYPYAAWLTGLCHDTGKLFTDMRISALLAFNDSGEEVDTRKSNVTIPDWRPEKESLIEWAQRFGVTRYDVTYLNSRVHRRHNAKSSYLLREMLFGDGLDYVLASPTNIHGQMIDSLNGYADRDDYLSNIIRQCDGHSAATDAIQLHSRYTGTSTMSGFGRVHKILRLSRPMLSFNSRKGHAWCIGKSVFLKWTSAFDVLIDTSRKSQIFIPHSAEMLKELMYENQLLKRFGGVERSVKFLPGEHSKKTVEDIYRGRFEARWEYLIETREWNTLFEAETLPKPSPGIIHMPTSDEYLIVNSEGETESVMGEDVERAIEQEEKQKEADAKARLKAAKDKSEKENKASAADDEGEPTGGSKDKPKQEDSAPKKEAKKSSLGVSKVKSKLTPAQIMAQAMAEDDDDEPVQGVESEHEAETGIEAEHGSEPTPTESGSDTPKRQPELPDGIKPFKLKTKTSNYAINATELALAYELEEVTDAAEKLKESGIELLAPHNKPGQTVDAVKHKGKLILVVYINNGTAQELLGEKKQRRDAPKPTPVEQEEATPKQAPPETEAEDSTPEPTEEAPASSSLGKQMVSDESEKASDKDETPLNSSTPDDDLNTVYGAVMDAPHGSLGEYIKKAIVHDRKAAESAIVYDEEINAVGIHKREFQIILFEAKQIRSRVAFPQLATLLFEAYPEERHQGTVWWFKESIPFIHLSKLNEITIGNISE